MRCFSPLMGESLFLASPRKSNQKEGDPASPLLWDEAPKEFPALLDGPGGCATRLRLKQCSPTSPGPSALLGGAEGG
jgi:hypothetical protein